MTCRRGTPEYRRHDRRAGGLAPRDPAILHRAGAVALVASLWPLRVSRARLLLANHRFRDALDVSATFLRITAYVDQGCLARLRPAPAGTPGLVGNHRPGPCQRSPTRRRHVTGGCRARQPGRRTRDSQECRRDVERIAKTMVRQKQPRPRHPKRPRGTRPAQTAPARWRNRWVARRQAASAPVVSPILRRSHADRSSERERRSDDAWRSGRGSVV